jgi:hypothetical protein
MVYWAGIRKIAGLPPNHIIQSANILRYAKGVKAGVGSHRNIHFDRHCRSVLLKISGEDEKGDGSLHIEGIPYPLRQGDMLCFSDQLHHVPSVPREHDRVTINVIFNTSKVIV